jgi:hypothetical protein
MSRKPELDRELDRLQQQLPGWAQWTVDIPRGAHPWVRVPAGVAFTVGGCFSILPGLGLWMIPVGVATLAVDVPVMRPPAIRMLGFINRKLETRRDNKAARRAKRKA